MSQITQMLDRKRNYDRKQIAYLTVLDPDTDGILIQYEVCNLLLRRPRITVTCRTGTTLVAVAEAIHDAGWEDVCYQQWLVACGQHLVAKGELT